MMPPLVLIGRWTLINEFFVNAGKHDGYINVEVTFVASSTLQYLRPEAGVVPEFAAGHQGG